MAKTTPAAAPAASTATTDTTPAADTVLAPTADAGAPAMLPLLASDNPAAAPAADEPAVMSETHTYPDGSSVVGRPPWPKKSPIQRAAEAQG